MINLDKSMTEGFYFDCKTPREAAIKNLVLRENNCEYQEAEHSPQSGIRTARFLVDEKDFNNFQLLEDEFRQKLDNWEEQIAGDIKNKYSWVGTSHPRSTPGNSFKVNELLIS